MNLEEKIVELLEEKFKEEEFTDCFLIDIKLHKHNKLDIFLDSDTGITFRKCQRISRYLESFIDEEGWLGEKYVLEVSSPGLTRPLKLRRQYLKNIGRKVEVNLLEGKPMAGKLIEVNEEAIVIEREEKFKEGKKTIKKMVQIPIPFENIKKTVVTISYK
jgi:ribosome maturation factor RimP